MLVSCIMPTRGRSQWATQALQCWLSQSYQPTELLVFDDMDAPSFPGGLSVPRVTYTLLRERMCVGAKRNLGCSRAHGEIVCHFDDDDWSAPERISDQLELIDKKPVVGYHSMEFHATDDEKWFFSSPSGRIIGTSLMYRRDWWADHPFPLVNEGEDVHFVNSALLLGQTLAVPANGLMRATTHSGNTSRREPEKSPLQWRRIA